MVCALLGGAARPAHATPPRDGFLAPARPGNYAHLDAFTVGTQLGLENRADLEPGMSQLSTRAAGLISLPYADGSMNVDARVAVLTVGASAGYRWVYRNLAFDAGQPRSYEARSERESAGEMDTMGFGYAEGRVRLALPLDDFFLLSTLTRRFEDRRADTFDWYHADIHGGGWLTKEETVLLYRHRSFGAVGPLVRYMNVPKDGGRHDELHAGLVFMTRPGLVRPKHHDSDLVLAQVVGQPGGSFLNPEYGLQGWHVPLYVMLVYRATLALE